MERTSYPIGIIRQPDTSIPRFYLSINDGSVVFFDQVDAEKMLCGEKMNLRVYCMNQAPIVGSAYLHRNGKQVVFQVHLDSYFAYYHDFVRVLQGLKKHVMVFEYRQSISDIITVRHAPLIEMMERTV